MIIRQIFNFWKKWNCYLNFLGRLDYYSVNRKYVSMLLNLTKIKLILNDRTFMGKKQIDFYASRLYGTLDVFVHDECIVISMV